MRVINDTWQYQHLPSSSRHMYPSGTYFSWNFQTWGNTHIEIVRITTNIPPCTGTCIIQSNQMYSSWAFLIFLTQDLQTRSDSSTDLLTFNPITVCRSAKVCSSQPFPADNRFSVETYEVARFILKFALRVIVIDKYQVTSPFLVGPINSINKGAELKNPQLLGWR